MRGVRVLSVAVIVAATLLAVGFTPSPARATTITVGNGPYSCNQAGLVSAIADAGVEGTVTFDCPSPYTIAFTSAITIGGSGAQSVTIDGSNIGHEDEMTFDGGESTNFFLVDDGDNLTVEHLAMRHGFGRENGGEFQEGGAIDVDGSGILTATDVTFDNNQADFGGAIDNDSGTVTINQSTFSNNQAESAGGVIYNSGSTTVTQSTFSNNQAYAGGAIGNAIPIDGPQATLIISQSTFSNNQAKLGGAVYNERTSTITQSSFIDNHADRYGGALHTLLGTSTVVATTFSNNTAEEAGSTLYGYGVSNHIIAWSTIVQPKNEDVPAALFTDGQLTLTGVILGGDGNHCQISGGTLTDAYTLANDTSCNLSGTGSRQGIANLGIGTATPITINGVDHTYYPLMQGSLAIDGGTATCDTSADEDTLSDPDQIGTPRPASQACDIGAIESPYSMSFTFLCANQWNGQISMANGEECGRSSTLIELPQDGTITLCVNTWNGATRMADHCGRGEYKVTASGDHSIATCVNRWNGTLRVSNQCSRSEYQSAL